MKLQESKQIFKDWNKYKSLISEVTEKEKKMIKQTLQSIAEDPTDLPFGELFGDKVRIVVPLNYDPFDEDSALSQMLSTLATAGWNVDLNTGLASKEYEREFEGVTRTQTRQMKINAIWTTFLDLLKKHELIFQKAYEQSPDLADIAEYTATNPELNKISSQLQALMGEKVAGQFVSGMAFKKAEQKINEFMKIWQTEATKIKGKMQEGTGYSMIISRHPMDVLRMSDFGVELTKDPQIDITSCHSPPSTSSGRWAGGGSYYPCAVAEARNGGGIAFLVRSEDIEGMEISNQEEIFADPKRDIEGIVPLARIRLRNIADIEEGFSLAVPEKRVYGPNILNFYNKLKQWTLSSQGNQFGKVFSSLENNELDLEKFELIGGSYSDTPIDTLFSDLLTSVPALKKINVKGKIKYDYSSQRGINQELSAGERKLITPTLNEFNEQRKQDGLPLRTGPKWYIEEREYIHPEVYHYYNLDEAPFKLKQGYEQILNNKMDSIVDYIQMFGYSSYAHRAVAVQDPSNNKMRINFEFKETDFSEFGITNIESLQSYLKTITSSYVDMREQITFAIEQGLIRNGVFEGQDFMKLNASILDNDFDSDWELSADDDPFLPKKVEGQLELNISYNDINIVPEEAHNVITYSFVQKLKQSIMKSLPKSSDYNIDIIYDFTQSSVVFTYTIYMENTLEDRITQKLAEFLKLPANQQTAILFSYIDKLIKNPPSQPSVTAPKATLQEFKQVTNKWKKFIL